MSLPEAIVWLKYKFFEKGISPNEFKKCQMRDIREVMDIQEAIEDRKKREDEIQDAISRMGRRW